MSRKSMFSIIVLAPVTLPGMWLLRPASAEFAPPAREGAWLSEATIDGVPGLLLHYTTAFSGNGYSGSYTITDTTDFGFGGVTPGFDSPGQGTWKVAGDTVVGTSFYFSYDEVGTHTATIRATFVSIPDPEDPFTRASGEWMNEVFLPGQDPMMSEDPVQVATGTFSSRRITP